MKLDEIMIFAPVLIFLAFGAWGVWKQRKNPRLPLAFLSAAVVLGVCFGVGMGWTMVIGLVVFVACAISGMVWLIIRLLR